MRKRRSKLESGMQTDTKQNVSGISRLSTYGSAAMGISNFLGDFDVTDGTTGPTEVIRQVLPFSAFVRGYSLVDPDGISAGDTTALLGTSVAGTVMYPVTEYAKYVNAEIEPLFDSLFQAGLTQSNAPPITDSVRYIANVCDLYATLYSLKVLNWLVYHTDWTKIYPYSGRVPSHLSTLATQVGADDVYMANTWLPYVRGLDSHVLFPRLAMDIKRMLTPMLTLDLNGRVLLPSYLNFLTETTATILTRLSAQRTIMNVVLADARRAFMSYMPFSANKLDLWSVSDPVVDVNRLSGWFNSSNQLFKEFEDTGDPADFKAMICYDGSDNRCVYYTMSPQPVWDEIKMSNIYGLNFFVADNTYELLTPHNWGNIHFFDDLGQVTSYDGSAISLTDNKFELVNFAFNRFVINATSANKGLQMPGYLKASIHREDIIRMLGMEVRHNFHADHLTAINSEMTGAALRIIRREVTDITGSR